MTEDDRKMTGKNNRTGQKGKVDPMLKIQAVSK